MFTYSSKNIFSEEGNLRKVGDKIKGQVFIVSAYLLVSPPSNRVEAYEEDKSVTQKRNCIV